MSATAADSSIGAMPGSIQPSGDAAEHCRMIKAIRLRVVWAQVLGLPWAAKAREVAGANTGSGRWVKRLKDGCTLILKACSRSFPNP